MKKLLLSCLSITLCIGVQAQSQNIAVKQNTSFTHRNKVENLSSGYFGAAQEHRPANVISAPRVASSSYLSSSYNAFGIIVTEANCLTANQATNTVLFTHRINPDIYGIGSSLALQYSGFIQAHSSSDLGATWDSIVETSDQVNLCRYPSGTLFNRASNTQRDSLYAVVSGPVTNSTNWIGNYFADMQLNGTHNTVNMQLNATTGVARQDFVRIGMQQMGTDKVVVTGGLYKDANGTTALTQLYRGATINYGTWDGTSNFTWTIDSIKPHFMARADGSKYTYTEAIPAFSEDGVTGYIVFSGVDTLATGDELAFQPIVYKTTNSGATWAQIPLFDFSSIPAINSKLMNTSDGTTKKAWYSMENGFDAVVDNTNNLHIFCGVASAFATAPDSLDYTFIRADRKTYLFDTYTTSGGSWNAFLVDSLLTVPDTNTFIDSQTNTPMPIDARIQASRSTDGTHIFYEWLDCDPSTAQALNAIPDIHARGYNATTALLTPTNIFTFDGIYYYLFASNIALVSGTTYTIPCTYSGARSGNDAITPFNHFYVSGVQFDESEFTITQDAGINEFASNGNLQISQNYPNPFDKTTTVAITLKDTKNVTLEVFNTLGEKMISQSYDKLNTGTHTLTIDGSKLSAGVYFYTVKAGNDSITRRMIVQ